MKYDFIVVGLPRSGTHMLGTALQSHPDILCNLEEDRPLYGDAIKGRVWTGLEGIPEAGKYIFLSRPVAERQRSLETTGFGHWYARVPREQLAGNATREIHCLNQDHMIWKLASKYHALVVTYRDLTGDIDTEILNPTWTTHICAFLGVRNCTLRPRTRKPIG